LTRKPLIPEKSPVHSGSITDKFYSIQIMLTRITWFFQELPVSCYTTVVETFYCWWKKLPLLYTTKSFHIQFIHLWATFA